MKSRRILSGMMSVAMLFSMAATPVYAIEEQAVPGAPDNTYSEPMNGTPEEDNTYKETETNAPVEPADTQAQPDSVPDDAGTGGQPDGTENPAPLALNAPAPLDAGETFAEVAEKYYGNNGSQRVGELKFSWVDTDQQVYAGETFQLSVHWVLDPAGTYSYATHPEPLFDTYDNTTITLTLPEGVSIVDGTAATIEGVIHIEQDGNQWKLYLDAAIDAKSTSQKDIMLPLKLDGNGTRGIGETLNFISQSAWIDTQFTIRDRTDPGDIKPDKTYTKEIEAAESLGNLTTATQDKWGIQKSPVTATPDENKQTITATYTLQVGLIETTSSGEVIVTNSDSYGRPGRVPFTSVTLTELPCVKNREGTEITAQSITVTPKFGTQTPIKVSPAGDTVALPVDTCAGKSISSSLVVDSSAPYLSEYTVTVVYPYEDFIAEYYEEKQDKLTIDNSVTLNYTLKGGQAQTATSTAQLEAGEVTQPARLDISKYIVDADGIFHLYSSTNFPADDPVKGSATFTIARTDGEEVVLYTKDGDKYVKQEGSRVTVDPAGTGALNSTTGTVTVYLDPGKYTIQESGLPKNTEKATGQDINAEDRTVTIAAGGTGTAAFYNTERVGTITVHKTSQVTGGTSQILGGAKFGLYADSACTGDPIKEATSDATTGDALFGRLPYDTYYIKEISAPDGYIKDENVYPVTLSEDNQTVTQNIVNKDNHAPVLLQKQMFDGKTYVNVDSAYYQEFNGSFSIQKKNGDTWEPFEDKQNLSLSSVGQYAITLPVYDDEGNLITYRFAEELPAGWHAAGGVTEVNGVVYSQEFTLEDYAGNPTTDPYKVTMQNDRNGSITLTKNFYDITRTGYAQATDTHEASFTLYTKNTDGTLVQYGTDPYTTSNGQLEITNLPRDKEYYLVENAVAGYVADPAQTGNNTAEKQAKTMTLADGVTEVTAWGPFDFESDGTNPAKLDQTITVNNYQNKIGVIVKKQDSITNAFVSGAKFTVYEKSAYGNGLTTATPVVEATAIPDANGVFITLDPGKEYIIVETTVPANYTDVTLKGGITVDLKNASIVYDKKPDTYTLLNRPDPKLLVNKTVTGNNKTDAPVTMPVTFEVYQKEGNAFTPVKDSSGNTLTITSGTAASLPEGTYYLKETVPSGNPNHILDPNQYADVYAAADDVDGEKVEDNDGNTTFYFGPFDLKTVTSEDNQTQTFEVKNYSEYGTVTVTKYAKTQNGDEVELGNATLAIYRKAADGTETLVKEGVKSQSGTGTATFTDLLIYDADGSKITYTIRETAAPTGYTVSDTVLTVQLEPGQTVTTGTDKNDLKIVNLPQVTFNVTKVFYNIWDYAFSSKVSLLPGAQIALYQKQADGSYKWVATQTTNVDGEVKFTGLSQLEEYVAVEYSIPNVQDYAYLEPIEGDRKYLSKDYPDGAPNILTAEQLKNYYYVTKPVNEDIPLATVSKTLTNVEHWAQLNIKKWKEDEKYTAAAGDQWQKKGECPVNNAEFDLYMQVLDDTNQAELTYTNGSPDYTLVGHYSSGTLYSADGKRLDGWFGTDILKSADNVVYWLVERTPGTGAKVNPATEITLIKRQGTSYTNNSQSLTKDEDENSVRCDKVMEYQDDTVTKGDVENLPTDGPGTAMFSTVRIAKWAGSIDAEGNKLDEYTPLGNATFELWVTDADGTPVALLDTITTGLDNDLGQSSQNLTAWASSRAFSFEALWDIYAKQNDPHVPKDIIWVDNQQGTEAWEGNGYLRIMLFETKTPAGYSPQTKGIPMLMYFDYQNGKTTEIFNDAFYVKGDNSAEKLTDTLSPDAWPCYPTREQTNGSYEKVPGVDGEQYRIVDWPVDNFAVTVYKFGYTVNSDNTNMTAAQLDEYYQNHTGRVPLNGVTMKLQRYDSATAKWSDYTYPGSTTGAVFSTKENGYFVFPNGLRVGRYRIIETNAPAGYEKIYDGTSLAEGRYFDKKAYYFIVTTESVHISLYNPEKLSLSIKKQNTTGTKVTESAIFALTPKTGSTITGSTVDGVATLTGIGSSVYTLSETEAPTGYTAAYLQQYLLATHTDKTAEVNGTTYSLGRFAGDKDASTQDGIYLGYTTEQKATGSYTGETVVTQKIDLRSYGVSNLVLDIQDPALCSLTITKEDAQNPDTKLEGAEFKLERKDFTSWSGDETVDDDGTWTDAGTITTDDDGTASKSGLQPGIYKVTETTAPDDYSLDTTPQYVVLTGGMNKTVTMDGETLNKDTGLTFRDLKKVNLTLTKTINTGSLTLDENHTFTFTLTEPNGYKQEQEVTFTKGAGNNAFQTATFTGLEQGKTYTMTETSGEDFALTGVTIGNVSVTPANNSWQVTVGQTGADVTVSAENTYLYGEVTILKVNGNTGVPLTGAYFEAYRINQGQPMTSATGTVTPVDDTPGEYLVRVPLTSKDGDSFQIKEVSAPAGYLEEHPQITVELTPGESKTHGDYDKGTMGTANREANDTAMLAEKIFPNYPGAVINIIKYDNMKEATTSAPLQGAAFTLYSKAAGGTWQFVMTETTGDGGKVTFTVPGNMRYAVTESAVPEGYQSLQGLWDQNGNAMATESDAGRTYYLIGSGDLKVGDNYTFSAYNVPVVEMEVRKQNALTPNDPTKTPTATVDIYEVPGDTPQQLTQQQVETLTNTADLVLKGVSVVSKQVQKPPYYSYADKSTTTALGTSFAAGKTYLVVETDASISQIRDNSQVVWYAVHTIPAGTKDKQVVTLKNLEGTATQTLTKTATTTEPFKSLLSQAATLEYTLTPTVNNTYPLDEYVITDSGLTAYNESTMLEYDKYLKGNYSITQVTLSGFSHNSANYNSGTAVQDLQATVTFYGFDGNKIYEKTVAATDEGKVVNLSGAQKAKYVTVSYASLSLLKSTGYALGQDFKPGTVKVTIRLDKQQGGEDVQAITKVVNTATSTLKYTPWTTTGAKGTQVTDTQDDTAENTFGEVETALVSITKDAEETAVNLDGGKIHYTVTLNNLQSAKADMQDPFIVDLLPQGTRFVDNSIQIQGEGVELENSRTETKNGETALFVFLKGNLSPGKSVDIELQLESTTSVALHGSQIANFVFAGSRVQGAQSRDNPLASSFKTSDNQWPKGIGETVTSLDKTRLPTLEEILDTMKGFGYIGSRCDVNWTTTSAATLIKTGKGDRSEDQGFSDSQLSTVNNGGSMQYQLIFSNLSASENYTDTTLLDVFPFEGDQVETGTDRGSKWGMNFERVLSVQKLAADGTYTDIKPANYKVFYYTGRVTEDNIAAVYDQAENLKFDTATLPGWTTKEDQKTKATAIAVAIKKVEDAAIAPKQSYVVTLQLKVDTYDTDELAELSWTNAVNNFVCHYSAYTQGQDIGAASPRSLMSSNSVSNTILPNPVKVGGHIWIDKDADGVWDDGESVSATDLQQSALVQKLLKQAEIRLYTYRGSSDTSSNTLSYDKASDSTWYTNANFAFENLDPATPLDNAKENQLYGNTETNKPLNPMYLKGYPDVKTYRIGVTVPTTSGILYRITSLGGVDPDKKTGYSRDPNQLAEGGKYEDEAKDNNYLKYSSTTSASEQFYLYATDPMVVFDNTKDIGFVLQRDLVINKTAATDPNVKLRGAEFKVYGPFDSVDAANQATLHDDGADKNLVTTVTTDASGQATIQGLNWFQCYVIVESKPAPNYRLEGADGKSSDAPLTDYTGQATSNPAWVLGIPGNTSTVTTQHMNVTNKTDVQYSIAATKALEGTALKDQQFQFELLDENMQRIKTAYNIGDVVDFGKFDANAAGTVTYYIREMIPAGAQGDVFQDIQYDNALYKVVVTITTDQTTGKLVPRVAYYRNSGSAQQSAVFTNVYLPAQRTTYQPAVLKQFTEDSDPRPSDAYFTFTLEPQADYGAAVELPIKAGDTVCKVQVHSGGPAYFDPIWFNEEGVYRFTIREVNEGKVGYRYDTATWTLEVQTVKSDGKLVVARADYSVDGKGGYTIAEFVNYYEEGLPPETPSQDGTLPATTGDAFIAQTSDPSNPVLWVVLMVVALVGVGVAFWLKKRGRNRK